MKSFFSSRVSKFNASITLCLLSVSTLSLPVMAAPQEACIKTSTGDVVCGELVPKPPKSNQPSNDETIASQTQFGVTWDLKSCVRNAKNVVNCTVVLTAETDTNTGLYAAPWTKLVDSSGNEYFADKVQVGKKVDQKAVSFSMAKGAIYRAIFSFTNVPNSVSQVVLFQISASGSVYTNFRNIPIN
jgi:hypothetical protein